MFHRPSFLLLFATALTCEVNAQHIESRANAGSSSKSFLQQKTAEDSSTSYQLVLSAKSEQARKSGEKTPADTTSQTEQWRNTSIWLETNVTGTSSTVPFWMRANRYGSVPLPGLSTSFIAHAEKQYNFSKRNFFDWGISFEGRANVGQRTNFTLIEGYGKVKLGAFEVRGGRSKEMMGFVDSTLSSGSFSVSGNALGIPKVELGVPQFTHLFGGKLFAFKGNLAHGWIGEIPTNKLNRSQTDYIKARTFFHQKSLYGRLGKEHWKVRLYGGFSHQVFWGSEKQRYGQQYAMSNRETFLYVLQGKMYKGTSSKIGNHLGSIDFGLELNLKAIRLLAYRQNLYEVGGLYYLANIQDGLHGISLTKKRKSNSAFQWKKLLFEFLYTKNQAGEPWSRNTPTGAENYYNNSEYNEGWSYKGAALGTPFITTAVDARKGFPSPPYDYFVNNRIVLFHTGIEGSIYSLQYTVKLSYSRNYGTWRTSPTGARYGGPPVYTRPPTFGIFTPVSQFSTYLDLSQSLRNGMRLGGVLAIDRGGLLPNTIGAQIRVVKIL